MSERLPPSRSTKAGKRGRHKHRGSPEARRWNREFMPPKPETPPSTSMPPARPGWMGADVYCRLVELRERL
jgi:hypothetical protein